MGNTSLSTYSPDLCSPDFDLFPKLKELLRRTCFGSLDELLLAMTGEIRCLNKEQLRKGIKKLPDHWQAYIN